MNVALPNGQRPTQTKAKAKGDMQGRPATPGSKPKNFTRGETSESQRLRGIVCTASPVRADRAGGTILISYNKKKKTKKIYKKGGNGRGFGNCCLHS